MDLMPEFEGMQEKLRAHVGQAMTKQRKRLEECKTKLIRLQGHSKDIASKLEGLPREKEGLLRQVSQGMASGADVTASRKKIREVESELTELQDIADNLRREGLPQATMAHKTAENEYRAAVFAAMKEVRTEFAARAKDIFAQLYAANNQWREAFNATLADAGINASASIIPVCDQLYPAPHQLHEQMSNYE